MALLRVFTCPGEASAFRPKDAAIPDIETFVPDQGHGVLAPQQGPVLLVSKSSHEAALVPIQQRSCLDVGAPAGDAALARHAFQPA